MMEPSSLLAYEQTATGWRGLTASGDLLDVKAENGTRASLPKSDVMIANGKDLFALHLPKRPRPKLIARYVKHINRAKELLAQNECQAALANIQLAIAVFPTPRAKFIRSLILLAMRRWREGFADYENRFALGNYQVDDQAEARGIARWHGESLKHKTLLLTHDEGFGDTIQMLGYVPRLQAMGANVLLIAPSRLGRLASTVVPTVTGWINDLKIDFFCPIMSIWHAMGEAPAYGPRQPFLKVLPEWQSTWKAQLPNNGKRRIGLAWSIGRPWIKDDFPREIPLMPLVEHLRKSDDVEFFSLQAQNADEAEKCGVHAFAFEDFADCAGLALLMNEIISIDTAAAHLAGAIGHPRVTLMLSYWASWRWLIDPPLYPNMRLCRQDTPGDWQSALAKLV
jgi:hypothetical protein